MKETKTRSPGTGLFLVSLLISLAGFLISLAGVNGFLYNLETYFDYELISCLAWVFAGPIGFGAFNAILSLHDRIIELEKKVEQLSAQDS